MLHNDLVASNAYAKGEAAAASVACPTLVVIGERDIMTPAKRGHALAAKIPEAHAVVIPGAGHMVQLEASGAVNSILLEFLEDITRRESSGT